MGDHDGGAAFGDDGEGALDRGFGFVIDGGSGFIQNQNGGVAENGAGKGNPLTLTAGELLSAFADDGVVSIGELENEVVGFGGLSGGFDFFLSGIGFTVCDVFADGAVEEEDILAHKTHCSSEA